MRKKRITLRAAMMLLVVLAIAPVAIFLTIQNVAAHRNAISDAYSNTTGLALKLASYPKEVLPEPKGFVSNISQLHEVIYPLDCDGFQNIANSAIRTQPYFIAATVFSPAGDRVCPRSPHGETVNIADREYFQRMLQTKAYTISNLLVGRLTKTESIIFSRPLLDERGNIVYVVNLALDAKWLRTLLQQAAEKYSVSDGTVAMIVDDG